MKIIIFALIIVILVVIKSNRYYNIKRRYLKAINILTDFDDSKNVIHYEQLYPIGRNDIQILEDIVEKIISTVGIADDKEIEAKNYATLLSKIKNNSNIRKKKESFKKLDEYEYYFNNKIYKQTYQSEKRANNILDKIAAIITLLID